MRVRTSATASQWLKSRPTAFGPTRAFSFAPVAVIHPPRSGSQKRIYLLRRLVSEIGAEAAIAYAAYVLAVAGAAGTSAFDIGLCASRAGLP